MGGEPLCVLHCVCSSVCAQLQAFQRPWRRSTQSPEMSLNTTYPAELVVYFLTVYYSRSNHSHVDARLQTRHSRVQRSSAHPSPRLSSAARHKGEIRHHRE